MKKELWASMLSALTLVAACGVDVDDEYQPTAAPEESESFDGGGKADSPAPGPEVPAAEQSADIGQFFMIEHYGVVEAGYADVRRMIRVNNLGAVILWNPTNASGEVVRKMITGYSGAAAAAGRPEVFYSADQEEIHTQRFTSRNGFTNLASGNVLGTVVARNHDPRICELHARITAREMASVGLNMTLGTVSDIYTSDSGTRGMFRTRAIGHDPSAVASCISTMATTYGQEQHVVFITKHFPGLGNASGNTDVDATVHTRSTTKALMETELAPYRATTAAIGESWTTFGAMISHASYPVLDGGARAATLSPAILGTFVRGAADQTLSLGGKDGAGASTQFAGMGLRGLTVSDAFWTWGAMRNLTAIQRQRLMARSFLAGMDILMISKSEFTGAWGYFQEVYSDRLPVAEQQLLVLAAGYPSWDALRADFRARITASADRIKAVKTSIGRATASMKTGPAKSATTDLVAEYARLSN